MKYAGNTAILWIIGFIPQITISLLLAAWFTDVRLKIRGKQFFKVVIYMPNLIMASAFAMLFFALFSDTGPVNSILVDMGILTTVSIFTELKERIFAFTSTEAYMPWFITS